MKITYSEKSNPYDVIARIIRKFCDKNDRCLESFIVTIEYGYKSENEEEKTLILEYDGYNFVWEFDWWEGQQYIELLGFTPVSDIRVRNIEYLTEKDML